MTIQMILAALLWGSVGGFLALQILANLLAAGFCLHGLLLTRWKRLAKKGALGAVKYTVNLKLLARVAAYGLLFFLLLTAGDDLVRGAFRFAYAGTPLLLAGGSAAAVVLVCSRRLLRRLTLIWKMSHQFDYAERRQRTRMLKG
jgi:hypothetical protein